MPSTLAPGVYVEWRGRAERQVRSRTDIAGFVGIAERGPLHKATPIDDWGDFVATFGGPIRHGFLAYAVRGFFANGGRRCWVVRVADPRLARPAEAYLPVGRWIFRVEASSPGTWGNNVRITAVKVASGRYSFTAELPDGTRDISTSVDIRGLATMSEAELSAELKAFNAPLRQVQAHVWAAFLSEQLGQPLLTPTQRTVQPRGTESSLYLEGGCDGLYLDAVRGLDRKFVDGSDSTTEDYGLAALEKIDEVSIVAIPDIMAPRVPSEDTAAHAVECHLPPDQRRMRPADRTSRRTGGAMPYQALFQIKEMHHMQRALVSHCERMGDRFAILDCPLEYGAAFEPEYWKRDKKHWMGDGKPQVEEETTEQLPPAPIPPSSFGAFYFPAIAVPDPLRVEGGAVRWIPPSGHIAGVYAGSDWNVGPHKPPANVALEDVTSVAMPIDDAAHGYLNSIGVNVLRRHPRRGVVVGGARTLSREDPFRFVNVRRLMIAIREWIEEEAAWIVFERNHERLWPVVERVVRTLLDDLWTRGMLDGATPEEAYSVVCDETTNPPERRDLGRIVCLVGVRLPRPVEFIWVEITVGDGGVTVSEDLRGFDA